MLIPRLILVRPDERHVNKQQPTARQAAIVVVIVSGWSWCWVCIVYGGTRFLDQTHTHTSEQAKPAHVIGIWIACC